MTESVHQPGSRLEQQKPKKRHPRIVWFLACLVVFYATCTLMLSSISMARTACCGLPHTGGIGTAWFTLSGAILAASALVFYGCGLRRRRKGGR